MKPHQRETAITEAIREVFREFDCTLEEARRLIHDAAADYEDDVQNAAEQAYEDRQRDLMETGGPDDATYRRDMIASGRGHLLRQEIR